MKMKFVQWLLTWLGSGSTFHITASGVSITFGWGWTMKPQKSVALALLRAGTATENQIFLGFLKLLLLVTMPRVWYKTLEDSELTQGEAVTFCYQMQPGGKRGWTFRAQLSNQLILTPFLSFNECHRKFRRLAMNEILSELITRLTPKDEKAVV